MNTGRRVRSETGVGAAPDVFVSAGADLGDAALGGLAERHAVVIGAGHMSALAVQHLRRRGVATVRVLNRSLERARALAERTSAAHGDLADLPQALAEADVVDLGHRCRRHRAHRAPGARRASREEPAPVRARPRRSARRRAVRGPLPDVTLVDIDGLRASVAVRAAETAADIERAHAIVADEVRRFSIRRRAERLGPLFRALRERGDAAVDAELERFRSDLAGLEPQEREAVTALARGVVAKLLHEPIVRLKETPGTGTQDAYARALAELFGLELPTE